MSSKEKKELSSILVMILYHRKSKKWTGAPTIYKLKISTLDKQLLDFAHTSCDDD